MEREMLNAMCPPREDGLTKSCLNELKCTSSRVVRDLLLQSGAAQGLVVHVEHHALEFSYVLAKSFFGSRGGLFFLAAFFSPSHF